MLIACAVIRSSHTVQQRTTSKQAHWQGRHRAGTGIRHLAVSPLDPAGRRNFGIALDHHRTLLVGASSRANHITGFASDKGGSQDGVKSGSEDESGYMRVGDACVHTDEPRPAVRKAFISWR